MREIKIKIPLENGYGTITRKIEGELNSIIIGTPEKAFIKIISEYGYLIYKSHEIKGVEHIILRKQSQDTEGHRISFSGEEISLNEKVSIVVQSQYVQRYKGAENNQEVKIILRLK